MELIEDITKYWTLIIALISVVISWTNLKAQNTEQQKEIDELKTKVESMNPVFTEIKEKLASIEATLKFLTK